MFAFALPYCCFDPVPFAARLALGLLKYDPAAIHT